MKRTLALAAMFLVAGAAARAEYLGQWSVNEYATDSTSNEYGAYGSPYGNTINNPYSQPGRAGESLPKAHLTSPFSLRTCQLFACHVSSSSISNS